MAPESIRNGTFCLLLLLISAGLAFAQTPANPSPDPSPPATIPESPRLLVLHSYHPGLMWTDRIQEGFQNELLLLRPEAEVAVEYLDTKRYTDSGTRDRLRDLLIHKYSRKRLDAVVTSDDNAFRFALELRPTLFPRTPIVFSGVNALEAYHEAPHLRALLANTTGVVESYDVTETLRMALALHSGTQTVYIINDRTTTGRANKRVLQAAIAEFETQCRFEFLETLSMAELLERVAGLTENSLVLLMSFNRDRLGQTFSYRHSIDMIAARCQVPIYGVWGFYLGRGIVGGRITDGRTQGVSAARLTAQILSGKRADDIPVVTESPNRFMFDENQLKRFAIGTHLLPEKRTLINASPNLWVRYRWVILATLVALTAQAMIIMGLAINIRRRHQAEHRLTESKAYYEEVFKNIQDAYYEASMSGDIREMSPSIENILGYRREELLGQNMSCLYVHPEERADIMETLQTKGRLPDQELLLKTPTGEAVACAINATLLPSTDGAPERVIGSIRNISARKEAEQALRHLRNYLTNIIDSMPSILVGVDSLGRVTQWNHQAERATGIRVSDARTQPLAAVFPRLEAEEDLIYQAIEERRVFKDLKVPNSQNGETRYEDVTIYPLVADGVEGAVIRVDDVTERVRLEEAMIQSEKMLSVGGLAAGMAHELNNPLAGILQNVAVISNRLFGDLPANQSAAEQAGIPLGALQRYLSLRKLPEMIENTRNSAIRASTIVKNMLGFARKSDHSVSRHDLCRLLDQTLDLIGTDFDMKKRYDFKKIRIDKAYPKGLLEVPCDPNKLQQVFLNLLKNGAEAMAERMAPEQPPAFGLRLQQEGQWAQIVIEDNGPGMDEKTRRHAFDPFFTTKPTGEGTGLGLSLSYYIITEDHGGEMTLETTPGKGTRFLIRLPMTKRIRSRAS